MKMFVIGYALFCLQFRLINTRSFVFNLTETSEKAVTKASQHLKRNNRVKNQIEIERVMKRELLASSCVDG